MAGTLSVTNIQGLASSATPTVVEVSSGHELHTNTLKGTTTAGSIAVQGENTATTNLQQGLCKDWINCSSDWGTVNDSFNNASVTDVTTGKGTFNFTNNMTGASYFAIADHHNNNASGAGSRYGQVVDTAASGVTIATGRSNNTFTYEEDGSYTEPGCHTMGDLA